MSFLLKETGTVVRSARLAGRSLRSARYARKYATGSSSTSSTSRAVAGGASAVILAISVSRDPNTEMDEADVYQGYTIFRPTPLHCQETPYAPGHVPGPGKEAHDPWGDKDYEDEPRVASTLAVEDSDVIDHGERSALADLDKEEDEGDLGKYIPMKEVARHDLAHDAWVVIDGKVYE